MSMDGRRINQTWCHMQWGTSLKKEDSSDPRHSTDEPEDIILSDSHRRQSQKTNAVCLHVYDVLRVADVTETDRGMAVTRGRGGAGARRCLMGMELGFCKTERFRRSAEQQCEYTSHTTELYAQKWLR